jgi:hypothetical protein
MALSLTVPENQLFRGQSETAHDQEKVTDVSIPFHRPQEQNLGHGPVFSHSLACAAQAVAALDLRTSEDRITTPNKVSASQISSRLCEPLSPSRNCGRTRRTRARLAGHLHHAPKQPTRSRPQSSGDLGLCRVGEKRYRRSPLQEPNRRVSPHSAHAFPTPLFERRGFATERCWL